MNEPTLDALKETRAELEAVCLDGTATEQHHAALHAINVQIRRLEDRQNTRAQRPGL